MNTRVAEVDSHPCVAKDTKVCITKLQSPILTDTLYLLKWYTHCLFFIKEWIDYIKFDHIMILFANK